MNNQPQSSDSPTFYQGGIKDGFNLKIRRPKNISIVLEQADTHDRQAGLIAYQMYHECLRGIANHYQTGFCQTVAAFAALSPNNDYTGNLRSLVSLIQGVQSGLPVDQITVSTYKACRDRAHGFLTGEKDFLMETGGPKTRAFYHNILKPECPRHITIDGHMYGVYAGERMTMVEAIRVVRGSSYEKIAQEFIQVARRNKLVPNQLQAILWFTWKRIHTVVYHAAQLPLFGSDTWGLIEAPEQIKPF